MERKNCRVTGRWLLVLVSLFLFQAATTLAQDDQWPPVSYLRNDFRESTTVAHVRVTDARVVHTIGGYEDWQMTSMVRESFKGKFRKGSPLVFYITADKGPAKDKLLGDKLVFLKRSFVAMERKWVNAAIENSTLPYNKVRARRLRSIAHRPGMKKRR
jgi:hypothetical protein